MLYRKDFMNKKQEARVNKILKKYGHRDLNRAVYDIEDDLNALDDILYPLTKRVIKLIPSASAFQKKIKTLIKCMDQEWNFLDEMLDKQVEKKQLNEEYEQFVRLSAKYGKVKK